MTETTKPRGRREHGRGNGDGSIRHRADGRWEARITTADGRSRSVYAKTRADAAAKLKTLQRQGEAGLDLGATREKVGPFLDRWLRDSKAGKLSPRTFARYEDIVRIHLKPAIGKHYLDALTPAQVQKLLNEKATAGLAPGTVKYVRDVLRAALSQALKWGLVGRNVAKLVDVPASAAPKVTPLSPAQARALIAATADHRDGCLVAVALYTGLRQGELLGLRWSDLDLDAGLLTVNQALKVARGEVSFGPPKSKHSRRTLPLSSPAIAAFRKQRARQNEERLAAGGEWHDGGLVFADELGRPQDGRNLTKRLQAALDRAGLPRQRFHDLRHGCASLLIAQGVPLAMVSRTLGHSTVTLTLDTYGHLSAEALAGTAAAMDAIFGTGTTG